MKVPALATGIAAALLLVNAASGQSTSEKGSDSTAKKTERGTRARKKTSSGKKEHAKPQAESRQAQADRDRTADRTDDPQMPRGDGSRVDPSRPGTPPTFPPNNTSPKTPVRPPDPKAPTAIK